VAFSDEHILSIFEFFSENSLLLSVIPFASDVAEDEITTEAF
jgi:hypothetical protein